MSAAPAGGFSGSWLGFVSNNNWAVSLGDQAYKEVTKWRNKTVDEAVGKGDDCAAFWTKCAAGVAYALLPVVFLIEMVVRAAIGLLILAGAFIPGIKESDAYKRYLFTPFVYGTLINAHRFVSCLRANADNATQDVVSFPEISQAIDTPCYRQAVKALADFARGGDNLVLG
jgi:peptidoglycan/LPS O-acetylase OafA/YrhL